MPFCFSPWTNIDVSPQGTLSPCCKFQLKHYPERYNLQTHDLDDYVRSDFLRSIREQFQQDQWPAGCERCQIEEHNNIKSKRELDYQRWQQHYQNVDLDSDQFVTASIAFGNTCNLKCITCNSMASSKWHREYLDVYGVDHRPVHFYRKNFVDDFVSQVPNLVHLDIPGGEPLLSGVSEQTQLLQHYIDSGRAGEISLHYTTNATLFPDQSWLDLWKQFKHVDIQLSIDGVGARYQYIRYPAQWAELEINVAKYVELEKQHKNLQLSVSHTVSAYNIFYIPEFLDWCDNVGLPKPWMGRVHNPTHMRPEVWCDSAKQLIRQKLISDHRPECQSWAQILDRPGNNLFDQFVEYLHKHDAARGLNFSQIFPELAEFV